MKETWKRFEYSWAGFEQQIERVGHVAFWESNRKHSGPKSIHLWCIMDRATEWGPLFIDPSPVRTQEAPDENSRRHEYVCASASTFFGFRKKERERDKEENWPAPSWQWSAFHGQQKRGNAASARQVVRAREIWLCTLGLSCKKPLVVSIWAAFYRCSCRCRLVRCYQRHLWDFLNFQ